MFSDKYFKIALTISLLAHTTILLNLPAVKLSPLLRTKDQVEVTYLIEKPPLPSLEFYKQELPEKPSRQTTSKSVAPPPFVKRESIFQKVKNVPINKPEFHKPEIIAVKKKITVPVLTNEKITNPVYLNYYQIIREKIKRAAYQNYTRLVNGEVYLSFVILNDGQLRYAKINKEKSSNSTYLKDIAQKSIYDASPFPSFPKDLNYPELSFNVIISFEVE